LVPSLLKGSYEIAQEQLENDLPRGEFGGNLNDA
jgi:hypothetical protein